MYDFNQAGFPGCIGSSDATHVVHEKCHSRLKNHHLGAKSTMATKAFNIVVNHRRKILNKTVGLLGHWNDKLLCSLMVCFQGCKVELCTMISNFH
jgi:hypothetical protein